MTHHLEIETYSFGLIPDERRSQMGALELIEGLEKEFAWVLGQHPAVETGPA